MPHLEPAPPPLTQGVAVALNSSFFGYYTHAAFMAELHRQGILPSQVAGASSGAIVSVLCGAGLRGDALVDYVMQPGMRRCFADWLAPLRIPGVATSLHGSGILSGKNAVAFFRRTLGNLRLEDCSPRAQIAVTNLTRRRACLIGTGDAAAYTMASCAVPGLFRHQVIDGDHWCDGGVALTVPFAHWFSDPGIHTIVIHRIEHEQGTEMVPKWPTLATSFALCHQVICDTLQELRLAQPHGKRIVEIVTQAPHPGLFPHRKRAAMLETGRRAGADAARRLLAEADR